MKPLHLNSDRGKHADLFPNLFFLLSWQCPRHRIYGHRTTRFKRLKYHI